MSFLFQFVVCERKDSQNVLVKVSFVKMPTMRSQKSNRSIDPAQQGTSAGKDVCDPLGRSD